MMACDVSPVAMFVIHYGVLIKEKFHLLTFERYFCKEDSQKLYTKSNEKFFLLFSPLRGGLWA